LDSIVHCSTVPRTTKPIQAIWSFKCKQRPDGTLVKHKARLCAHGGMEQWGTNYWETYAPVVYMVTVRLIVLLARIYKLDSKASDFVLTFPQAELDVNIWMYLSIGLRVDTENALSTVKAEYITICVMQSDTTYDTYERITHYLSSAH
jgi:hypothetical protein